MCKNCIYSTTCNIGIEDCEDFLDTDLYILSKKNEFREEFFEMMSEIEGIDYCEI